MVFRLERAFKIKIPRGKIVENARGDLPEAEFEQKGIVTDKGLAQLKAYLSEVPAERFKTPMKVADIPRLFTPETFCKLVVRAQATAKRVATPRLQRSHDVPLIEHVDHFAAYLVRRPHHRARAGRSARAERSPIPPHLDAFSVVPRRGGGRAARRVGRDGAHRFSRPAGRGARDRNALSAARRARATCSTSPSTSRAATTKRSPTAGERHRRRAGDRARRLPGPMLPVAEFDVPEAMRARFALLRDGGAHAGPLPRRRAAEPTRAASRAGTERSRAHARRVPSGAPFFDDHFPRRPVFPATLLLDAQIDLALDARARSDALAARARRRAGAHDARQDALVHRAGQQRLELARRDRAARRRRARKASCRRATDGASVATARLELIR